MENPFEIINEKLNNIEKLLIIIKSDYDKLHQNSTSHDELMTIQQVADYLSLAKATIYGMIHQRQIPNMKRGRRLYFKKSEIDIWLSQSRRKTIDEIKIEAETYISNRRLRK